MLSSIPTRRELLAWTLAIILGGTAVMLARPEGAGAGATGPTTQVVYIATGENFPDALGAAAAAAMGLGPVLLVQQSSIPAQTLAELNRLQPPEIVIVGGTAVVSNTVQTQLAGLAFSPDVTRIAGANRFDTAAELSQAHFPTTGLYPRAAHAESSNLAGGVADDQTLLSADIVAPAPGVLLINAGADHFSLAGSGTLFMSCRIRVDDADVPGSFRSSHHSDGNRQEDCTTEGGVDVAAGTHTVEYVGFAPNSLSRGPGSLTVLWVPFDGVGAVPSP